MRTPTGDLLLPSSREKLRPAGPGDAALNPVGPVITPCPGVCRAGTGRALGQRCSRDAAGALTSWRCHMVPDGPRVHTVLSSSGQQPSRAWALPCAPGPRPVRVPRGSPCTLGQCTREQRARAQWRHCREWGAILSHLGLFCSICRAQPWDGLE